MNLSEQDLFFLLLLLFLDTFSLPFKTIPSYLLDVCYCEILEPLPDFSDGFSKRSYFFYFFQIQILENITANIRVSDTRMKMNAAPLNLVSSAFSYLLSAKYKSSVLNYVFGSKPLIPLKNSGITTFITSTKNGLNLSKSATVHTAGTHIPIDIGIGKTVGIVARMYLKSVKLLQSSNLPKSL
jgi:hypothetical protein